MIKIKHKMAFEQLFRTILRVPSATYTWTIKRDFFLGNVLSDNLSNNAQRTWKKNAWNMKSNIVRTNAVYPIRTKITKYMSFNASYVV
jgi:hypothetical protein